MANVHGLNDPRNQRDQPNIHQPLLDPSQDEEMNLFMNPIGYNRDPRQESFCDMISFALQIRLRKVSPVKIIFLILLSFFIAQLAIDGISRVDIGDVTKSSFLQINLLGPLSYKLADVGHFIKKGEVYRLATSLLLHADLSHIITNSLSLLILGSFLEIFYSKTLFVILTIISGFVGNLYSLCWYDEQSIAVGFSTSLCGFSGALLGYLIFNWKNLASAQAVRLSLLLTVVWGFIFSVTLASIRQVTPKGNKVVSEAAHFGGFVAGTFAGMALAPVFKNVRITSVVMVRYMYRVKLTGCILLVLFALGSLAVFLM